MDLTQLHVRADSLHDGLLTHELERRASRPSDYAAENRALQALAQELAAQPRHLPQTLAQTVLELCRAGSAGISLHAAGDGAAPGRWDAVAGRFAGRTGASIPVDPGLTGAALEDGSVVLVDGLHLPLDARASVDPPIVECLVAPFGGEGLPAGAVWAISHAAERRFDAEDARLLAGVARFAAAGYRVVAALDDAAAAREKADERAAATLREGGEEFRALVTAVSDAVYRMNADWSEMRHLRGREFIADTDEPSRTWLDRYIHPDDQRKVTDAIAQAIRTKGIFELEHRVLRVDGSLGWTFSRAIPLLDDGGEIVEWVGTASDVTRRKEVEEALRLSRAEIDQQKRLYEAIISSTPDLVYIWDLGYRFRFANAALLEMWGRTLEDSVGRSLLEIGYEPWHAEMHEREIDQIIATKQPVRGEVAFPHATLGRRTYDYILVPVLGAGGEVEAVTGITRDVTERKRAEEELREAKQLAEAASQAKSQFLATMSHELRTPLTGVIGFAALMESEVLGPMMPSQQEALARIKASSWHLVSIIDEILTLARAEAGRERVRWEEADVAEIAREVVQVLEPQADAQGLALRAERLEEPLRVWTDPGKVRQILLNLAGNAVKYTERGGVTVALERDAGGGFQIHVRDTGPGIGESDRERIFEPFTQADGSHTRNIGGTGLGLAISRKLARLLGGDISLRSRVGEGSTFSLRLPIVTPGAEE